MEHGKRFDDEISMLHTIVCMRAFRAQVMCSVCTLGLVADVQLGIGLQLQHRELEHSVGFEHG